MKILLATDFTEASDNAINYIISFSQQMSNTDYSYVLVHAFKPLVPYSNVPSIPVIENSHFEGELFEKFNKQLEKLREQVNITGHFLQGPLPAVIDKVAEKEEPDLIVMGTREKSALERTTVGTNTMEVATHCHTPILAIPKEASFDGLGEVLITTDLEPLEIDYSGLKLLKQWIEFYKSRLTVLHVFKDGEEESLKNKIKDTPMHNYLSEIDHVHQPVVNKHVFEGIQEYADEKKPALLVAIPRDRGILKNIFHNSKTEKMAYHTQIPLLILVR